MRPIKPKILYLRRSEVNGPIELCVGMGDGELIVYEMSVNWLVNMIIDGNKLLYRHIDPMWLAEYQYPERIGNGRDREEA